MVIRNTQGANVYLASAELAAMAAIMGKLPTPEEYLEIMKEIDTTAADTYRYLNFDQLDEYQNTADSVELSAAARILAAALPPPTAAE